MGMLQTTLKKAEASVMVNEDYLEESWIREEETHQGDQGQSNSSEDRDDDVVVEGPEESAMGAESTGPLKSQEAEHSMEVNVDDLPPLTSGDSATVMPEEDEMLTGNPTSVAGEMARLQVSLPNSQKPKDGETPQ